MTQVELTVDAVQEVLRQVEDPELHRDLVALGMVTSITVGEPEQGEPHIELLIELTTPACPLKETISSDICRALLQHWPQARVQVNFDSRILAHTPRRSGDLLTVADVKNVVLIASGKGGVGKSSVAVNLAYALQQAGARCGLVDTDVYGPSVHLMVSLDQEPQPDGQRIIPAMAAGLPVVSMGMLVDPEQPVIWRGPMLAGAALQLLSEVAWGALDYLLVDLPPGTGDVQLSISQKIQVAGAVVVSTPQEVALADVVRAKTMFDRVDVETLGVIENMSYFLCDGCSKRHEIFASGGVEKAAQQLQTPYLGHLPLDPELRQCCDEGTPIVLAKPRSATAQAFREIAGKVAARIAVLAATSPGRQASHLHVVQ